MIKQTDHKASPLSRTDILITICIGLAALALYIRTLAPSLLWGDSAEFQTLSYTLGMTHPTGYATHIIIGKLFTFIPVHNIAYRVNLMSAFFGALAVANTFMIVLLLTQQRIAALSAALLLTLTPGFWSYALVAESSAPASGMLATVWLAFLYWRKTEKPFYLFIAGFIGALSIGIHSTVVMTASSVIVVMALTARKRIEWINASTGAFLGALLFLALFFFLDFHNPPSSVHNVVFRPNLSAVGLTDADYNSPIKRFLFIFPAGHFWSYYFSATSQETHRRLVEYLSLFSVWAIALIPTGAISLFFGGRWREGLYPLISFIIIWGFAVTVSFSVYHDFYAPVFVITSVWFGAGAGIVLTLLNNLINQNRATGRFIQIIIMSLLVILPIWNARKDLNLAIRSGYTTFVRDNHIYPIFRPDKAIRDANKIISRVEPNGIVLADWDKLYSYIYTAQIEGNRKDITFNEAWIGDDQVLSESMIAYINANIEKRPVYFTVDMPGLADLYHVTELDNSFYQVTKK